MNNEEKELFDQVVNHFQKTYPNRQINIKDTWSTTVVYIDDEAQFSINGYNLLRNLNLLYKTLEGELI